MGNKRWSRQTVVLTAIDTVVMDYMKVNNTQEPLTKLLVETHALSNGGTSCKEPVSWSKGEIHSLPSASAP